MEHPELKESPGPAGADAGGFEADYRAVTAAAGVRILEGRTVVRVVGDDRVPFFHGMCSADLRGAAPGAILPALILTEHAHVLADLFIWVMDDALLLDIDGGAWTRAREHLERLLVADDVEFEEASGLSVVDIEGPRARIAAEVSAGASLSAEPDWRYFSDRNSPRADGSIIGRLPRFGAPAFSVILPGAKAPELVARILKEVRGAKEIGDEVLDAIRIEHGVARVGVDTGDKTLALEARLDRAISFDKGCYVGQETIERATSRGALKKRMFGLKFDGANLPPARAAVRLAGREVGQVTSAARSPRLGPIGLAMLHHSAWQPGTEVAVAMDGGVGVARVSDLPFK